MFLLWNNCFHIQYFVLPYSIDIGSTLPYMIITYPSSDEAISYNGCLRIAEAYMLPLIAEMWQEAKFEHWNGKVVTMTALIVTGDVKDILQSPQWRTGQSPWRPLRVCVFVKCFIMKYHIPAMFPGKHIKLWLLRACVETELSFWRNFHHWLHRKLSLWQIRVQQATKISSKWHFKMTLSA